MLWRVGKEINMAGNYRQAEIFMQGIRGLQDGIGQVGAAFAREGEKLQAKQDKLDSLRGRLMFAQEQGMISAGDLAKVSSLPVNEAEGYLTSMEAKVTRDWEASMRGGGGGGAGGGMQSFTLPDGTTAYFAPSGKHLGNFDAQGKQVGQDDEQVFVIDPKTGQVLFKVPAKSKFQPSGDPVKQAMADRMKGQDSPQAEAPPAQAPGEFNGFSVGNIPLPSLAPEGSGVLPPGAVRVGPMAPTAVPVVDGGGEGPPVPGARKAPDGKWYVQKDGKMYRVE